nr:hypothetical protein [uncultured Actinoplanes sp.]
MRVALVSRTIILSAWLVAVLWHGGITAATLVIALSLGGIWAAALVHDGRQARPAVPHRMRAART